MSWRRCAITARRIGGDRDAFEQYATGDGVREHKALIARAPRRTRGA